MRQPVGHHYRNGGRMRSSLHRQAQCFGPFVAMLLAVAAVPATAQLAGPVTDPMGVVVIPQGAPITIGAMWVLSGPDAALGIDSKRGAEIAFKQADDRILEHSIHFVVEDDM